MGIANPRPVSLEEFDEQDFMSNVNQLASGCWRWEGDMMKGGYGFYLGYPAHRVAYQFLVEEIPSGLLVCHSCDRPPCVNPDHLWVGTQADNMFDRDRKRRGIRREKLTPGDVLEIRRKYSEGYSQRVLGSEYGVTHVTIGNITRGKTWKWVEE